MLLAASLAAAALAAPPSPQGSSPAVGDDPVDSVELAHAVRESRLGFVEALVRRPDAPRPDRRDVMRAVLHGEPAMIRALSALGADVDEADTAGRTPLFHAATPEVVRALLASGADPTVLDAEGRSALATYLPREPRRRRAVVDALLGAGAPMALRAAIALDDAEAARGVLLARPGGRPGFADLVIAVDAGAPEFVRLALDLGAPRTGWLDPTDPGQLLPPTDAFVYAIRAGEPRAALAVHRATGDARPPVDGVALPALSTYGSAERRERFWPSNEGDLLDAAIDLGDAELARVLIGLGLTPSRTSADAPASESPTPPRLERAAWLGDAALIEVLLDAGAGVDAAWLRAAPPLAAADAGSDAALDLLIARGFEPSLHALARAGRTEALMERITRSTLDSRDPAFGATPLAWAVFGGHVETARALLDAGADVDPGLTGAELAPSARAAHAAALGPRATSGRRDVDPAALADEGLLVFTIGATDTELAELLLERGAPVGDLTLALTAVHPSPGHTGLLGPMLDARDRDVETSRAAGTAIFWLFRSSSRLSMSAIRARLSLLVRVDPRVPFQGECIPSTIFSRWRGSGCTEGSLWMIAWELAELAPDVERRVLAEERTRVAGRMTRRELEELPFSERLRVAIEALRSNSATTLDLAIETSGPNPAAFVDRLRLHVADEAHGLLLPHLIELGVIDRAFVEAHGPRLLTRLSRDHRQLRVAVDLGARADGPRLDAPGRRARVRLSSAPAPSIPILVEAGVDPNARETFRALPLESLAITGSRKPFRARLRALLSAGADPTRLTDDGVPVVELLREAADRRPEGREWIEPVLAPHLPAYAR